MSYGINILPKSLLPFFLIWIGWVNGTGAQTIYGATGWPINALWEVDIVGCSCDITQIGLLLTSNGDMVHAEGGIALCPDGTLYVNEFGDLFSVDPSNALCTQLPGLSTDPYNLNGLACAGNGILYGIAENQGQLLFEFNINSNSVTPIGYIPFSNPAGMFMHNSSLYMALNNGLAIVDTVNPSNSSLIYTMPGGVYIDGATMFGDCNMVLLYTYENNVGYRFRLLSLLDFSLVTLCGNSFSYMFMTGTHEFNPSSCTILLDLDCNDSSGASDADFNSPAHTCLTPLGVPVADQDAIIISDKAISEMTITISPSFIPDGSNEYLDVAAAISSSISVIGAGSHNMTLINSGGATISDFIGALRAIVYRNNLPDPTEGQRTIEVQYVVDSGEACDIASAYIEVIDLPDMEVQLGPDVMLCDEESVTLNAGNAGATYLWSTNEITQTISADIEGNYAVTVSNGLECPASDTVFLDILPNISVSLGPDTYICDNEIATISITTNAMFPITVELEISPGTTETIILAGNHSFTAQPEQLTTYTITNVISSEPACIEIADPIQLIDVLPTYYTIVDTSICNGDSVWLGTYWQTNAGVYGSTYSSQAGCDSIVNTTITILPQEMILHQIDTCDPAAIGVVLSYLPNPNGCDTIVQTTIQLLPSDTSFVTASTCLASEAGVQVMSETGSDGCDSVIIKTLIYSYPIDTTSISILTCNPLDAGIFMDTLLSSAGCDSLVQQTVIYSGPDTTYTFSSTCVQADTGLFFSTLTNSIGCDSIIIQSVGLSDGDTTYATLTSCDLADIGVHEEHFISTTGCDSLHITNITFSEKDSLFIHTSSCVVTDTGVFQNMYINQFGCDSVVTTHVTLAPTDHIMLQNTSCHPADTGQFITHFFNQYGCDSIVTNIVSLAPSHELIITSATCHPVDTGTFIQHYLNQYGCDSLVTSLILLVASDTTILNIKTCDESQVGSIENLYTGMDGCDSLVIMETSLYPLPQLEVNATSDFNGFAISCFGESDGSAMASMTGISPFEYIWSTSSVEQTITGLSAGAYAVSVTDGNGCTIEGSVLLFEPPPFSISFIISEPDCFDQERGSILVQQTGGIAPFQYSIDGVNYQSSNIFSDLSGGTYEIKAIDANDCETKEIIWINVPLKVNVELGSDFTLLAGDTAVIHALVNVPYDSLASIIWTGLTGPDCPACLTQPIAPVITTSYSVIVESTDGCVDEDSVTVSLLTDFDVFVPNIFSPNGDGINDRLIVYASPYIDKISLFTIFDRWGNLVFEAKDFKPGEKLHAWDGNFRGNEVNPGVFLYRMIRYDRRGNIFTRHGDITVVK